MDPQRRDGFAGHESKCRRCGRCCFHKLLVGGCIVYTDLPCPHLDLGTRLCQVYDRRHEANIECLSVEEGIERGVFPADCPYVAEVPGYVPPMEHPDQAFLGEALASLAEGEFDGAEVSLVSGDVGVEPGDALAGLDAAPLAVDGGSRQARDAALSSSKGGGAPMEGES